MIHYLIFENPLTTGKDFLSPFLCNFSIHSDAPVTPLAPLFTAWCAINRRTASGLVLGEHERISLNDALYAITLGAAYTLKLDHVIGSIESGKFADFAVLDEDPLLVEPDQLKDIKITKKSRILLALSGGVDSMVLMDLLYRHNYKFSVAHCNFCLRGEDSDLDQQFITSWSKSRNITFFIKKFNTKEYAKKNKISIQMAARDLRYNWFNNLYVKYDFNFIATAHHLNDSVETILFHLIRGTGIAGLHGIKVRDNHIIRPLVQFSKEDLLQYAHENDIEYRVDSSNSDNKYIFSPFFYIFLMEIFPFKSSGSFFTTNNAVIIFLTLATIVALSSESGKEYN